MLLLDKHYRWHYQSSLVGVELFAFPINHGVDPRGLVLILEVVQRRRYTVTPGYELAEVAQPRKRPQLRLGK